MDYEKLYKDALERARQVHTTNVDENKKSTEYIFPELKDSEDERIRKNLLELFHDTVSNDEMFSNYGLDKTEVIAWLEKQSKCNTIDVDGMVSKYSKTKDGAWGLPVKCQIKAYRQGINDVLNLVVLNKQCEQSSNILWHDVNEEPEEKLREIFLEWETNDATWHDVAFYRASTKTFWNGERQIEGVVKWTYVDEMLEKQNEPQAKDFEEFINKLSEQFPEVSFAKLSRIAVRVINYTHKD